VSDGLQLQKLQQLLFKKIYGEYNEHMVYSMEGKQKATKAEKL
jgi:hypothetical protein